MPTRRIIDSWLKSITPHQFSPEELTERLMYLGIEIESFEDRFATLEGFVVGEVKTCGKHPNADKLSVCTVSYGQGEATVVCGAPNVAAGQRIAFAPVGTEIRTVGFTIERRKIRGIESQGMICSLSELGLGDDHSGILVLPDAAPVGAPLASVLGDVIYETEITANRPDCLSHLGFAREVAALTGNGVFLPAADVDEATDRTEANVSVTIEDPLLCPRYAARLIRGVRIAPSPPWLQEVLSKLGLKPRNNVVDITSYVLFECGHPLHAFDFGRIAGGEIVVRAARGGERFVTLDGKEHALPEQALLICDAEKPVAIAGVMGGANSEISDETVDVLLESAFFKPSSIRRTARFLGVSTDASYRFERGADIGIVRYAIDRAASMIAEIAGGEVLEGILDVCPNPQAEVVVEYRFSEFERISGVRLDASAQTEILTRLGFGVHALDALRAMVTVPTYRVDVLTEIDLIEEVLRLHHYERIPLETQSTLATMPEPEPLMRLRDATRQFLVDDGFTEILPSYLTDPETANRYGQGVELRNALGRDSSVLRTAVAPSAAAVVARNERYFRPDLRLFEVGTVFRASESQPSPVEGIVETTELSIIMTGASEPIAWDTPRRNVDLFDLRGVVERYLERMGYRAYTFEVTHQEQWGFGAPALALKVEGIEVGRLGSLDTWLRERYDVSGEPVLAVIDLIRLADIPRHQPGYRPPSRYPVVNRDLSILVDSSVRQADIERTIRAAGAPLLSDLRLFDLYRGLGLGSGRQSLAYSLTFSSFEGTLDDVTIETTMRAIIDRLTSEHGAQLRGS